MTSAEDFSQQLRVSPSQKLNTFSYSLDTASGSTQALEAVCRPFGGQCPDAVFACAGRSRPKFFVEMDEQDLVDGMTDGYWVQAWTAWVSRSTSFSTLVVLILDL
jgi:3-dehydrosphinganine reductase